MNRMRVELEMSIDLIGQKVTHFLWGDGVVLEQTPNTISVEFFNQTETSRSFAKFSLTSPDTFRRFLKCHDAGVQRSMLLRDIGNLPSVKYDGVEWWRKAPSQWLNIDLIYAKDKTYVEKLEAEYEQSVRRKRLDELSRNPVPELLSKAAILRREINEIQLGKRSNSTNDSVKLKAYEGVDYIEAALSKTQEITDSEIRGALPMLSAFYRNIGDSPRCYTDIYKKYKDRHVLSGKFYISLAASYCDMGDADDALRALDIAYLNGESESSVHAQRVYQRIQALLSECDDGKA